MDKKDSIVINGGFKYSKDNIKEIMEGLNFGKVPMQGFYDDLLKIKTKIEKFYDDNIFYLGYILNDAPYYGWEAENLKEMRDIDEEICTKFKEIYAIVLKGLGYEE